MECMPSTDNLPFGKNQDVLIEPRKILSQKSLENILRQCRLKVTKQRLAILQVLNTGPRVHLTAQDILNEVRKNNLRIGFATVYRFLKHLVRSGNVTEISMGHSSSKYELKSKEFHYHITCIHCGKIIEFKNKTIENSINKLLKSRNYTLEHQSLELYVKCNSSSCS